MKKILFIIGLMFLGTKLYAQKMHNDIKRYDYREADMYDGAVYSVLQITDLVTNEKECKLRVTFTYEKNGVDYRVVLFYSDGVVAEMIKTFNYLINAQFEPVNKGEKSFICCEVGEGIYFKYNLSTRHLDLMVRVVDSKNNEEDCIFRVDDGKNKEAETQRLAGIDRNEIGEFQSLLQRIENAFANYGRNMKDSTITNE